MKSISSPASTPLSYLAFCLLRKFFFLTKFFILCCQVSPGSAWISSTGWVPSSHARNMVTPSPGSILLFHLSMWLLDSPSLYPPRFSVLFSRDLLGANVNGRVTSWFLMLSFNSYNSALSMLFKNNGPKLLTSRHLLRLLNLSVLSRRKRISWSKIPLCIDCAWRVTSAGAVCSLRGTWVMITATMLLLCPEVWGCNFIMKLKNMRLKTWI